MLKSTKLKNTLLVGATAILVSCGGQKEIKMGSYAYDAQFLKNFAGRKTPTGMPHCFMSSSTTATKNLFRNSVTSY